MPYIDIATGARLAYIDTAPDDTEKEVVIAVHGMLGTAQTHLGHVIDWLSPDYRVLGPTMRGYGYSQPKPRTFPPDFYRRDTLDVIAFMDALGIKKAHVLGYSDGGEIALMMGGLVPDRCLSVASWGAVGYFGPKMREVVNHPTYPERLAPTPTEMTKHGIMDRLAFAHEWIDAILHMVDEGGDISLGTADQITAPLLLMLGHGDTLNPAVYAERYIQQAGHGQLEMFDCGHPVHDEQTAEFRRVVGAFLKDASAG